MMEFIQFNQSEIQSTREYWTDERMASAIPIPLPEVKIPKRVRQQYHEFSQEETEMSFCGSGYNPADFCANDFKPFEDLNTFIVNVNNDPYNKVGRFYFTLPNGKGQYCTAQVMGAQNIILTVAHALKEDGRWFENMMFVRASHDSRGAQTCNAVVTAASIHENWDLNLSYYDRTPWDYGFARITPDSNVGYMGLSLSLPSEVRALGYPLNYGNVARYLYETRGFLGVDKNRIPYMQNYMSVGASGGAWLPKNRNEIVGINSCSENAIVLSPIFDHTFLSVFQRFYIRSARGPIQRHMIHCTQV